MIDDKWLSYVKMLVDNKDIEARSCVKIRLVQSVIRVGLEQVGRGTAHTADTRMVWTSTKGSRSHSDNILKKASAACEWSCVE